MQGVGRSSGLSTLFGDGDVLLVDGVAQWLALKELCHRGVDIFQL